MSEATLMDQFFARRFLAKVGRLLPAPKAWDSKVHKAAIETVRLAREALLDDQNGDRSPFG